LPHVWRSYHNTGDLRIDRSGAGAYRLEVVDSTPDTHFHVLVMAGFFQQLLEMLGARDCRATVLCTRARGDERTVTALRWKA